MVRRSGWPPVSADVARQIRAWVDEMTQFASILTAGGDQGDDREKVLAQLSVAVYLELYMQDRQRVLARLAQELGSTNRSLAWACGITPQTAQKKFPPPAREELPPGTVPSGSRWRRKM